MYTVVNVFRMLKVSGILKGFCGVELIFFLFGFLFLCLFVLFTTALKYFPRSENSEAVKLHGSLSLTHDVSAGIKYKVLQKLCLY